MKVNVYLFAYLFPHVIGPSESCTSYLLLSSHTERTTIQTTRCCARERKREVFSALEFGGGVIPVLTMWFRITDVVLAEYWEERDRNHLLKWLLHDAAFSNKAFQQHFQMGLFPMKLPQRAHSTSC